MASGPCRPTGRGEGLTVVVQAREWKGTFTQQCTGTSDYFPCLHPSPLQLFSAQELQWASTNTNHTISYPLKITVVLSPKNCWHPPIRPASLSNFSYTTSHQPCYISAIVGFSLLLKWIQLIPASGPLHLLFPLPLMLSGLRSMVIFSESPFPIPRLMSYPNFFLPHITIFLNWCHSSYYCQFLLIYLFIVSVLILESKFKTLRITCLSFWKSYPTP